MYCTSCGAQNEDGSAHCTNCGTAFGGTPVHTANDGSIPSGCLILFISIFTMPIKTAKLAAEELRAVAKAGALETDSDFPHLSWHKAVLPVMATICSIGVLVFGAISFIGLVATGYADLGDLLKAIFGTLLLAIAVDWAIMLLGEWFNISIAVARYVSRRDKGE